MVFLEVSVMQEIRVKTEFPLTVCQGFSHTTQCGYQAPGLCQGARTDLSIVIYGCMRVFAVELSCPEVGSLGTRGNLARKF